MFSRICSYHGLLAALVTVAHANIMVESVDGSFVPWRFTPRAPTDLGGLAVRLTNLNDTAYLVSLNRFLLLQVSDLNIIGHRHYGWVIQTGWKAYTPTHRHGKGTPQQQVQMSASLSMNYISVASPPSGVNSSS
jgi:hypothetical protein